MTSPSVVGADTADAVNNAEVLGANEIIGVPDTLENRKCRATVETAWKT